MRASAYPLVDADEAAALVLENTPVLGVERVALAHCVGRVLAEDLVAPASLPAFPSSAVDGYAVRAADAGKPLRVLGESAAGRPFAGTVEPGTAARILTGGVLPDGADSVVMVEDVRFDGEAVIPPAPLRPGTNFHRPGADLRVGERVASAGIQMGAAELGLAAALGFPRLPVHRRPRVALMSTGDELVEVGGEPGRGKIVDANRGEALAALAEAGAGVRRPAASDPALAPRLRRHGDRRSHRISTGDAAPRGGRAGRRHDRFAILIPSDVAGGSARPRARPAGRSRHQGRIDGRRDDPVPTVSAPRPAGASRLPRGRQPGCRAQLAWRCRRSASPCP